MKELTGLIIKFLRASLSITVAGNSPVMEAPGGHARTTDLYDEALMASISDEIAHQFLEFCGPRGR